MRLNRDRQKRNDDPGMYMLFSVVTLFGIVAGAVIAAFIPDAVCKEAAASLGQAIGNIPPGTSGFAVISFFTASARPVLSMWIAGFWRYGIIVNFFTLLYKGITTGFCIALFIRIYSLNGIMLALAGIMPQHVILLPLYVVVSVLSIKIGRNIFANKSYKNMVNYIAVLIIGVALCILATAVDVYISSALIKNISYMIE